MIHEFRIYKLHPGKRQAFLERFSKLTLPFFEKHGIRFLGFWEIGEVPAASQPQASPGGVFRPAEGASFDQEQIAYLVAFPDVTARDRAWAAFVADEGWRRTKAETEQEGPLVAEEDYFLLRTTIFSPLQ